MQTGTTAVSTCISHTYTHPLNHFKLWLTHLNLLSYRWCNHSGTLLGRRSRDGRNFSIIAAAIAPPNPLGWSERLSTRPSDPMGSSLNDECGTHAVPQFQPSQIVGLEYETSCLYAEVVQIIESSQSCWVRPLVLTLRSVENQPGNPTPSDQPAWYDLRHDSDLLLPLTLFRVALDVEVLPWLANFYTDNDSAASYSETKASGHQRFREFIREIWQAHPEVFQDASRLKKT